jgi:serine protease Do
MRRFAIASGLFAVAIAIALGCSSEGHADPGTPGAKQQVWREGTGQPAASIAVPSGASLAPLVKAVKPAVVNVSTTTVVKNPHAFRGPGGGGGGDEDAPDFFQFFGPRQPREFKGQSLGSGFIIHAEGYVLTNNPGVENATDIKVRLADSREVDAKLVGRDKATDVALLKLEKASGLPTVALGDSDALEQGDYVLALGSPFGFRESVTFGIVSAKDRTLNTGNAFDDFIQTDAAINQGNSGGPLFNLKGEVVGINTAIISPQIGQGLGFAVPINLAKGLIPQFLESGKVARGYMGVSVQDLSSDLAAGFGVPAGTKGALVQNVIPGAPASKAGVQAGDIVVGVNGKPVEGSSSLTRAVSAIRPGGKVKLEVLRGGKKTELVVTVDKRPDEDALARGGGESEGEEEKDKPKKDEKLGVRVAPLTPELARELRVQGDQGVVVVGVTEEGPADKAGIRRGDLILEVKAGSRTMAVSKVEELAGAVGKLKAGEVAVLRVRRGDQAVFVPVKVGGEPAKK